MSASSWVQDVEALCRLHGASVDCVRAMTNPVRQEFFKFRLRCLQEEMDELHTAATPADAVDAIVDLIVFALGTLVAFGVDADRAWAVVRDANLQKVRGVKPGRPNPFGLPDLVKPDRWTPPDHSNNVSLIGQLEGVFSGKT